MRPLASRRTIICHRRKKVVMKTYEYWRERDTGEVWAVKLLDGVVTGCCGPLDPSELEEQFLRTFDYSAERAAWTEAHRDAFDLYALVHG
jgi:hypothetical protein